ncbi:MAG: CDP-alcohol phosphatidyltransferase family protein [Candidatus Micrarchaeota archaeon]
MRNVKDWVTLANAFFGFTAILVAISFGATSYWTAVVLIGLAVVADLLDGRIARATKTQDAFGMHLDSLADAVSFGVAPVIVFLSLHYLQFYLTQLPVLVAGMAFLGAALVRLARFNTIGKQKHYEGLPTPAAALILVVSAPYLLFSLWLQCGVLLVLAFLMLSRFKFKAL